jgi:hypothetical protein
MFSLIGFFVIMLVTERPKEELPLIRFTLLSTFYTGYFLRLARIIAYTIELFFFSSYKDPWNPKKTSEIARIEGI